MHIHLRDSCDPVDLGIYICKEDKRLARLTNLEFSITREMAPLYQLGSGIAAVSFGRGMRGIAGIFEIQEVYFPIPEIFDIEFPNSSLKGSYIMEEGKGIDMNNIITQVKYTFVAKEYKNILT